MRGRKPQSADEKLAAGNPGRRPVNLNEPKYDPIDPTTPAELTDPIARREWNRIAPILSERGHATVVDRALLLAYCFQYARWISLEVEVAAGALLIKGSHGGTIANPLIPLANKAYTMFIKAANDLGLTPLQRPRVVGAAASAPVDEFSEFARSRPKRVAS